MIILTNLRKAEILWSFRFVLGGKASKEILESLTSLYGTSPNFTLDAKVLNPWLQPKEVIFMSIGSSTTS